MTRPFRRHAVPIAALALLLAGGCATTGRLPDTAPFTAAQVAMMRDAGFQHTGRGWEFSMADRLLFETDKSDVLPGQAGTIGRITHQLSDVGIAHVEVEGHTDNTGSAEHNDELSLRRATAVADVMAANGLDRTGIKTQGLGQRYPVESNSTSAGRRENRRVVILITAP